MGFCRCCLHRKIMHARGLCAACYVWATKNDTLIDYERIRMRTEDRIDDLRFLQKTEGLSVAQAAERMGITTSSLYRTLQRAGEKP